MALRTALYEWHKTHGGTLVEFGGWELPIRYSTLTDEHNAVRQGCGLFDISHMARLSFSGSNVLELLQKVWTNNAATMKDNQVRYGLICNANGGIRDDVLIYRWSDSWAMVVNASNRAKICQWLHEHRQGIDAQIHDATETTVMLALQGPKALELSAGLFPLDISTLKYYFAVRSTYKGEPCVLSRTGYTGEDGFEVSVKAEQGPGLAEELLKRGAVPCGLGARDTLRLEAAMPLYGHELSEEIDPLQAGLAWAVKLDKGEFIGKEAILKRKETARSVRVGLEIEGKRAARENASVVAGADSIGKVTSGTITPTIGKAIAMAYVDAKFAEVGTSLGVEIGKGISTAKVVALPFYKRQGK